MTDANLHIFTDFDGTITDTDSLVFLTRELGGGPAVLDSVGKQLRANTMTLREGITTEMATIRAPFAEAEALLRARIKVDPDFPRFVQWCRAEQIPLTVLSAGFHEVIDLFLPPTEFPDLNILASRIQPLETGWQCVFRDDSDYGHDKAAAIERARAQGYHTIFIGDGLSDRASAEVADEVFAKRYLAEYCRARGIACREFQTFAEVLRLVTGRAQQALR
ncbi:MAG TPA: HAD-IB family phosphatase [Blastocatellia bacterium]|nr:HAD-IB family phosphatase [Blastocatellia bacterium]